MHIRILFLALLLSAVGHTQLAPLTIEKIMADPKWMGSQPGNPIWSTNSKTIYFSWNPNGAANDSTWQYQIANGQMQQVAAIAANQIPFSMVYNNMRTQALYAANGDVFLQNLYTGKILPITQTQDNESNPMFLNGDSVITFMRSQNVYSFHLNTGTTTQLTQFVRGTDPNIKPRQSGQEQWLQNDQLSIFEILKERKDDRETREAFNKNLASLTAPKAIYTEEKMVNGMSISPNGQFVTYRLSMQAVGTKNTIVPAYVTESGFTTDINGRTKVGAPLGTSDFWLYDIKKRQAFQLKTDSLPGITDIPAFLNDYPKQLEDRKKKNLPRAVSVGSVWWNAAGTQAAVSIVSQDNKDRWLMLLDAATAKWKMLDRQHDEAWIGGPGIGGGFGGGTGGWINNQTFYFQSEASGYSHLYSIDINSLAKKQLTSGNYEVQSVDLSNDKQFFYITTNEVHPGEHHFYKLPVGGGTATKITSLTGANEVSLSPDEQWLAIRYSYSNKPWELYIQKNIAGSKPIQITNKAQSDLFKSYAWRDPEIITFKAADGATVYGRLYKPAKPQSKGPAVIFVHGAGYLQNAHKWWSSYFREYMFHNLLVDNGYTVLDIDYRASAGYGRKWRTDIYRFMGGKDLSDHVDAAAYLTREHGVDAKRIGIYGGSYGGFITLMALFTEPGKFAAGAALRPVTDWAHYNHGYTANILNTPKEDSIAYQRSSPIYHAAGLQDQLLICHGMVDVNVHFQDVVRLQQRLIELGKNNWELAAYPMEDHGFVEPSSWTDEYKRIFKLFETILKKP